MAGGSPPPAAQQPTQSRPAPHRSALCLSLYPVNAPKSLTLRKGLIKLKPLPSLYPTCARSQNSFPIHSNCGVPAPLRGTLDNPCPSEAGTQNTRGCRHTNPPSRQCCEREGQGEQRSGGRAQGGRLSITKLLRKAPSGGRGWARRKHSGRRARVAVVWADGGPVQ